MIGLGEVMLYTLNAQYMKAVKPRHHAAKASREWHKSRWNPWSYSLYFRAISATLELVERLTTCYEEPA